MRLRTEQGGGNRQKGQRGQSGRNGCSKMTQAYNEGARASRSTNCLLTQSWELLLISEWLRFSKFSEVYSQE